ncbi:kinase-like protein, partial [Rhizoclosmatium globosum]
LDHEIAIWASLEHPHLLGMIQMMDVDDAVFIVSELAEGGNLLDYVSKYGRLKEHVARSVVAQVVDALVYLHTIIRVVHRDVKLDNVLVMEKVEVVRTGEEWVPTVKLADFGLSERLERGSGEAGSPCGANREDGYCVGSLHYCAPEEVRAVGSPSPAADVWSLGCVLYTVLCGALPFNDDYLPRLQMAIMKGEYDEGRLERCGVSEVGRKLVREMLEVNVEKRLTIQQVWSHPFF